MNEQQKEEILGSESFDKFCKGTDVKRGGERMNCEKCKLSEDCPKWYADEECPAFTVVEE